MSYLKRELHSLIKSDSQIFDFIQDIALDGLWYMDVNELDNVWINPRFWNNLGYEPEGMPHVASSWKSVLLDDPSVILDKLEACRKTQKSCTFDLMVRFRHNSGRLRWIHSKGMTIKGQDGKISRLIVAHSDITELKAKEDFLYQCNSTARIGYWEVDLEKGVVYWSPITKELHEVPDDFMPDIQTAINFVKEGSSRDLITKVSDEAISHGTPYAVEVQLITAKGKELWAQAIGKTYFENGTCVRFYGTFQDITERKLADLELKRTMLLLNDAQRIAKIGAWSLDVKTNWITWSEEVYRIHEVDLSFDCNLEKGISFYHPDYTDVMEDAVQRAIMDKVPFDLLCKFITAKGNEKWVRASGYPVVVDGEVIQLTGMFQDVSQVEADKETIRREQAFSQEILRNMADGFCMSDPSGRLISVNDSFCRMTGFNRDEMLGSTVPYAYWPAGNHEMLFSYFREVLEDGPRVFETELVKKNGETINVIISASKVLDNDGNPRLMFASIKDITMMKRTEQELRMLLKISKDQIDRLSNFAHIVSHNLRTNAGNVQSLIKIFIEEHPTLSYDEILCMAEVASDSLMETVESLGQMLSIKSDSSMVGIDLRGVVDNAIKNVQSIIKQSHVHVVNDVDVGTIILGVGAYMDSIVMNFLTNGIRYRDPAKESYVRFSSNDDGEFVVLKIEDNGLGIDLGTNGKNLFGFQKTFHNHPESHGVGLFITRNQIEAQGGDVHVESEVGKGTSFYVRLRREVV